MSELPHGWADTTLGDVMELRYGKSLPEKDRVPGAVGVYGSNGIVGLHTTAVTEAPAIVVGRKGSIGEVHFSKTACFPIDTTYFVDRFECTDPRFSMHLLRHLPLREMNRASAIPGLNREDAYGLAIALPPIPEQQRIAAKIDNLIGKSKRARDHLDHIPRLVDKYKQAVLAAAFRGEMSRGDCTLNFEGAWVAASLAELAIEHRRQKSANISSRPDDLFELPRHWCWTTAEMVVEPGAEIVYGIVQPGPKLQSGVPYVRGTDIENGRIKLDQLLFTSEEIARRYERASLRGGDILLGIIRATKVAVVPQELEGGNITQGTARFRPSRLILTHFLARWLESPIAQSWLHSKYRGIDMPGLNLRDVRQLPVPLPPLDEQKKIASRIEHAFAWIDRLSTDASSARKLIDHLDQAVLAKAFRGELALQDPNDEPATVLLERIKAERGAVPKRVRKAKANV